MRGCWIVIANGTVQVHGVENTCTSIYLCAIPKWHIYAQSCINTCTAVGRPSYGTSEMLFELITDIQGTANGNKQILFVYKLNHYPYRKHKLTPWAKILANLLLIFNYSQGFGVNLTLSWVFLTLAVCLHNSKWLLTNRFPRRMNDTASFSYHKILQFTSKQLYSGASICISFLDIFIKYSLIFVITPSGFRVMLLTFIRS